MTMTTEPNWKNVADNFWYAAFNGDVDLLDYLVDKYTDWFDEDEDDEEDI